MGGSGSGNWCRWSNQTTLDEVKKIDIRKLKKWGYLNSYRSGVISWSCNDEPSGNINIYSYHDCIKLKYKAREYGSEWASIEQTINIVSTPCHYGGERKWLECPHCKRRMGILCIYGTRFYCRHCNGLSYASSNESKHERLIRKKHKLGERIFEHYEYGEGWGKRKGMHQKTFDRLYLDYQLAEYSWYRIVKSKLSSCLPNN